MVLRSDLILKFSSFNAVSVESRISRPCFELLHKEYDPDTVDRRREEKVGILAAIPETQKKDRRLNEQQGHQRTASFTISFRRVSALLLPRYRSLSFSLFLSLSFSLSLSNATTLAKEFYCNYLL